jgi:hypothetical protein
MDTAGIVLGYIAVIGGLSIAPLAIVMGIRHDRQKRELEHIERMRALELGRKLPQDEPWLSAGKIGALIAIIVPVGAFSAAWQASQVAGYHEDPWFAAAGVGTIAVICGSGLVAFSHKRDRTSSASPETKPYVEEDAYDVVSSRG